jgi:LacI family transcriptional regulator
MSNRRGTVTAAEVAQAAGVSKWTAIRAFDPDGVIAETTRERVLAVAQQMGYAPNLLARSLATKRTHQVAILVNDFGNPYKLPTLERLTAGLQRHGMIATLLNINSSFDHVAAFTDARRRQVDAVVLFGTTFDSETLEQVQRGSGPPYYVLARPCDVEGVIALYTHPTTAMETIGEHLIATGRKSPAFLCGPKAYSTGGGRRSALRDFFATKGVKLREIDARAYDLSAASIAVREEFGSLAADAVPDAMVCENDVLAIGALEALRSDLGFRVPEDIAVIGFDDIEIGRLPSFNLTTWQQPDAEMVDQLVAFLAGKEPPRSVSFTGNFMRRATG